MTTKSANQASQKAENDQLFPSGQTAHRGFGETELRNAFHCVRDSKDWKAPICMAVNPNEWPLALVGAAVEFYTATSITVEPIQNSERVLVTAPGYRNGPAW